MRGEQYEFLKIANECRAVGGWLRMWEMEGMEEEEEEEEEKEVVVEVVEEEEEEDVDDHGHTWSHNQADEYEPITGITIRSL